MKADFATNMLKALEQLQKGFSSFTGKTITGGIWEGNASENARNQVSTKIDPKIESATTKLNNLIEAIGLVEEAETAKYNVNEANESIKKLDTTATNYNEVKRDLESKRDNYQKTYDKLIKEITAKCK